MTVLDILDPAGRYLAKDLIYVRDLQLVGMRGLKSLVPLGSYFRGSDVAIVHYLDRHAREEQAHLNYYIRREDLQHCTFLKVGEPPAYASGCCGPSGDACNVLSPDGLRVAYETADCYSFDYLEIVAEKVLFRERMEPGTPVVLFALVELEGRPFILERAVERSRDDLLQKLESLAEARLEFGIRTNELPREALSLPISYLTLRELLARYGAEFLTNQWLFRYPSQVLN